MNLKRVTALLTFAVMTCVMTLSSVPTIAQAEDAPVSETPFITNYDGGVQLMEGEETTERSFYLSAEKVVNVSEVSVCGWAQAGSDVDIYLNGKKVSTLTADESTGIYSGVITLGDAESGSEHEFYAVCGAEKSNTVKTVYDVNKPTVEKVEMDIDGSDRKDITSTFTQGAPLDVEFILGCPINFHIKATNSDSICRMFVTSGQGEDARMLEAFYRAEDDIWETDGLFAPDDDYYTPEELNICIVENGAGVVVESDIDTEKIGLNNIPEKVIENSSAEVLYHDDDTQLTRINISDGTDSDYYEIMNASVDTITVDGVEYPKEEIAKAPEKYGFSKSVSILNNDGSVTRTYVKTEEVYPDCDAKIKELQDLCFDIVKKGTKILTTDSASAALEIAVREPIDDKVETTPTVEATITAVEGVVDIVKIIADNKAPSVTPASMVKSILSAGSTWAGRMKDAQSNYNDKDMMLAASVTFGCKVGIIIAGGLLTAMTGGIAGAVIATAGSTIFNVIEKYSWHDVKTFTDDTVYETTEKPKYEVKTSDFSIDSDGTVSRYRGNSSYVVVPPVVNGIVVRKVGVISTEYDKWGLPRNYYIKHVVLPSTVTELQERAFCHCYELKSISIPDSVTSIGEEAFIGCTSLTEITIPDSVTSIGSSIFSGCTSLTDIKIPNSLTLLDLTFSDCTSLTEITIPDSVTWLHGTFVGCTSLINVTIPDSVTFIGSYAFRKCTSLESITIPDSVTSIGEYAFDDCTSLTNITIPDLVTSIGRYAFISCKSLTNITIPDSVTSIGGYAFIECDSLTDVYYGGTEEQWEKVIGHNEIPSSVTIHFNSPSNTYTKDDILIGDVNLDGSIGMMDVVYLNKYFAHSVQFNENQMANADCKNDGQLNSADASALLKYVTKKIDSLPANG